MHYREPIKIYAESFADQSDLDAIVREARAVVNHALAIPEASQAQDGGEP
jgi:hypothetical protein